ncbi:MAG: hypothetical protein HZA46_07080 [Planctomycetales bacterium]|nr:hypothetical protein [Planctomycetales bacterium]
MPDSPLTCPYCSTRLRVRERIHVGRPVNCPECRQTLVFVETAGELSVTKMDRELVNLANRRPAVGDANRHARLVAWTAAGAIAIVAATIMFWPQPRWSNSGTLAVTYSNTGSAPPSVARSVPTDPTVTEDQTLPRMADTVPRSPVENQFANLGRELLVLANDEETFPIGTFSTADQPLAPDDRFSWIAVLEAANEPGPTERWNVRWDRAWRDPHHDPFVRRRISRWQNAAVLKLAGDDGYPATHFVGVAGVGDDAPRLPIGHPRAGVFGDERQTRLDDIADGTSETLLLAGVAEKLGSWAAGGSATVRPFTREPFVNGPDGFGTGKPNSMFVLLADGSVRTLAADTDPDIIRRLATINDNAPSPVDDPPPKRVAAVDPTDPVPAPGPQIEKPAALAPRPPNAEAKPAEPPPPPKPARDITAALNQPLLRFEQVEPIPLRQMLRQLEELIGTRFVIDDEQRPRVEPKLNTPVKLRLQRTTVGDVLRATLHQAGLTFRIEADVIQVLREDE